MVRVYMSETRLRICVLLYDLMTGESNLVCIWTLIDYIKQYDFQKGLSRWQHIAVGGLCCLRANLVRDSICGHDWQMIGKVRLNHPMLQELPLHRNEDVVNNRMWVVG